MTTDETARFKIGSNGDVTIELSASATAEEEAVAIAIAEEMCATANGIDDEEDADENADDFAGFMRQRVAEAPKPQRSKELLPQQKQLTLLTHLDDKPGQDVFWEDA
jgi:hypothetical protein